MSNEQQPANSTDQPLAAGWRDRFFEALRATGNVAASCRAAGVSVTAVRAMRHSDAPFAEQCADAVSIAASALWMAARTRAISGFDEPVYHGGEQVGTRRRYSDALLRMLIAKADPSEALRELDEIDQSDEPELPLIVEYDVVDRPAAERFLQLDEPDQATSVDPQPRAIQGEHPKPPLAIEDQRGER